MLFLGVRLLGNLFLKMDSPSFGEWGPRGPVMGIKGDKNDLEKEMEDLNQETGVHLRVPERLGAV